MERIATKSISLVSNESFVQFTDMEGNEREVLATSVLKIEHFDFGHDHVWFLDIGDGHTSFNDM